MGPLIPLFWTSGDISDRPLCPVIHSHVRIYVHLGGTSRKNTRHLLSISCEWKPTSTVCGKQNVLVSSCRVTITRVHGFQSRVLTAVIPPRSREKTWRSTWRRSVRQRPSPAASGTLAVNMWWVLRFCLTSATMTVASSETIFPVEYKSNPVLPIFKPSTIVRLCL